MKTSWQTPLLSRGKALLKQGKGRLLSLPVKFPSWLRPWPKARLPDSPIYLLPPPPSFLFVSSFFSSSIFSFYQPNFLYLVKWYLIHVYTELYLVCLILNIESFCLKSLLIVSFCFIIMFPLFFELLQCSSWYGGKWPDPVYTNNLPSLNEIMPLDTKK